MAEKKIFKYCVWNFVFIPKYHAKEMGTPYFWGLPLHLFLYGAGGGWLNVYWSCCCSAYPHQQVGSVDEEDSITLKDWAAMIKENFEDHFYIKDKDGAKVEPHAELG